MTYQTPGGQPLPSQGVPTKYRVGDPHPIPLTTDRLVARTTSTPLMVGAFAVIGLIGILLLILTIVMLLDPTDEPSLWVGPGAGAVFFLLLAALVLTMRTVFDANGVHSTMLFYKREIPWPPSRTGFFVLVQRTRISVVARLVAILPDGKIHYIFAPRWTGVSYDKAETKALNELNRIWAWAVAKGYATDGGRYIIVKGGLPGLQQMREDQERRCGILPPLR